MALQGIPRRTASPQTWALVVDANDLMRESIRLYLATLGWRAQVAPDPAALAGIAREATMPGLIVSGEVRGVAEASQVFDWILLHYGRPVPALVLTGEPDPGWIGVARRGGVAVFCETAPPLDLQELLRRGVRYVEERLRTAAP